MHADDQGTERRGSGNKQQEKSPALLEWLMGAAGLLLLLSSMAYLGYEALTGGSRPPAPTVQAIGLETQGEVFLVRIRVRNEGDMTGTSVRITGALSRDGSVVERTEAVLDYLPAGSTRDGGLFFSHDPRQYQLELRAAGYQDP